MGVKNVLLMLVLFLLPLSSLSLILSLSLISFYVQGESTCHIKGKFSQEIQQKNDVSKIESLHLYYLTFPDNVADGI